MRTSYNLSCVGRSLLVSVIMAALVASPQMAAGQGIVQQRTADPVADFQSVLPPVLSIPWLEVRSAAAQQNPRLLPKAGTVAAWLLTPDPAVSWASSHTQAALTGDDIVGM